jgi:2,3-bisphosphoglycerate-independent phosphoglycerate mutase
VVAGPPPGDQRPGAGAETAGPDVLVILDGASEALDGARQTSLERACTPALDALARGGTLARVRTVPVGLAPGSEVAIPVLLGWTPTAPVDRGAIEAAAHGIAVPAGARAWRVDVLGDDAGRADAASTRRAALALRVRAPAHAVHPLAGHRLLLVGAAPLPDAAQAPYLRVWPEGVAVPRALDATTVVIAARGAGAGVAALLGARVVVPDGATGGPATDLHAKATAAAVALTAGARHVVVHVGGADEAAHARDAAGKVAFLERADRELLAPLAVAVGRAGGTLRVCPDHGCDPVSGTHDAHPVPSVTWTPAEAGAAVAREPRRFTEREVARLPVVDLTAAGAMAGRWPSGPSPDRYGPPRGVSA